ncbi:MAG: UDP-galactose phosphate transferase [Coriobacteriia bacterium]|nr:MAG: UDP-galactose phosphate transferase [Coriobacteriia bacterium]
MLAPIDTSDVPKGIYARIIKRGLDVLCSLLGILGLSWLLLIVAVLVRIKLGNPVLFKQLRPGKIDPSTGCETIFYLYKFRTMTDERDEDGNLLPDDMRLTSFGKFLRSTSLDELPELFNILKGDMSVTGPRPQLVRDMVFMSPEQRKRHLVAPGLSGLAQVSGRNAISWEDKLQMDLVYIENISFIYDVKIVIKTFGKVFARKDVTADGMETAEDYGDYLLRQGKVPKAEYEANMQLARDAIAQHG